MKNFKIFSIIVSLALLFSACDDDEAIDTEKPEIDISFADAFPVNCDTLYFGETFELRMLFSDNVELGAFSIDIHNNFDHHSHSTEVTECDLDEVKDAVNPYVFINDYSIDDGLAEYETNLAITLPDSDDEGLYDAGDYHFFISITDKEGWSTQTGLSIKILHR